MINKRGRCVSNQLRQVIKVMDDCYKFDLKSLILVLFGRAI